MSDFQPIEYQSPGFPVSAATFFRPVRANFVALASTAAGSGASLIAVNLAATNYAAASQDVEAHLVGIHTKFSTISATTVVATGSPGNYTPITTSVQGHLQGIDIAIGTKQGTVTGGATTIVSSNLTVSRALVSDGSGKVAVATTTATEIGYVNGVTSAIQTQINAKEGTVSAGTVAQYYRGDKTFQSLIAVVVAASGTPTNYTPVNGNVQAHLEGIDRRLGTVSSRACGYNSGSRSSAATLVIAHGLGTTPTWIRVSAAYNSTTQGVYGSAMSVGIKVGSTYALTWVGTVQSGSFTESAGGGNSSYIISIYSDNYSSSPQNATVTMDATNITFTFTLATALSLAIAWEVGV